MLVPGFGCKRKMACHHCLYRFKRHNVTVITNACACGVSRILIDILAQVITEDLQEVLFRAGKKCLPDA